MWDIEADLLASQFIGFLYICYGVLAEIAVFAKEDSNIFPPADTRSVDSSTGELSVGGLTSSAVGPFAGLPPLSPSGPVNRPMATDIHPFAHLDPLSDRGLLGGVLPPLPAPLVPVSSSLPTVTATVMPRVSPSITVTVPSDTAASVAVPTPSQSTGPAFVIPRLDPKVVLPRVDPSITVGSSFTVPSASGGAAITSWADSASASSRALPGRRDLSPPFIRVPSSLCKGSPACSERLSYPYGYTRKSYGGF